MENTAWLLNRLKAMSIPEIVWRIKQKSLQKKEQKYYGNKKIEVTDNIFNPVLRNLVLKEKNLALNLSNKDFSCERLIQLLGKYDYDSNKNNWYAGFQAKNNWQLQFSYLLMYKQRDDIGDARINWELNRHFQFALLAKDYAATGEQKYLSEFESLFYDWNRSNPFLWGISWTSVMEVAIRLSNWCYSYCFLKKSPDTPEQLLDKLHIGILNMTDYITMHFSKYSSANNHLIIEAYAIGQSGILFEYRPWIDTSISILSRELTIQNYSDGINKELSLHYQSFYMEAMGLLIRLLKKNGLRVPDSWVPMLDKMCRYMANCLGKNGEVIEFGDNDEGKILDLYGREFNYYRYVLALYSYLLPQCYISLTEKANYENLNWLFSTAERETAMKKPLYTPTGSVCYREGGNSILRSRNGNILIGIDHAALGFNRIAAHGHADALSFQMSVNGEQVFIDPGTYIYHCDLVSRNAFRKTINHNTLCINRKDQSEMLGAFLWGRKAKCKLLKAELDEEQDIIEAEHDGYLPDYHRRCYCYDHINKLTIRDIVHTKSSWEIVFILSPKVIEINVDNNVVSFKLNNYEIVLQSEATVPVAFSVNKTVFSQKYGKLDKTNCIILKGKENATVFTTIVINKNNREEYESE